MANTKATETPVNLDEVEVPQVETVEQTATRTAPPNLTPFAAAKVVTAKGRQAGMTNPDGSTFELAPQTMYGLAKRNVIATTSMPGSKKIFFDGEAFETWLKAYFSGRTGSTAGGRQDYDRLAEQYLLADEAGLQIDASVETESVDDKVEAEAE
jgi:hypothetical protein